MFNILNELANLCVLFVLLLYTIPCMLVVDTDTGDVTTDKLELVFVVVFDDCDRCTSL